MNFEPTNPSSRKAQKFILKKPNFDLLCYNVAQEMKETYTDIFRDLTFDNLDSYYIWSGLIEIAMLKYFKQMLPNTEL